MANVLSMGKKAILIRTEAAMPTRDERERAGTWVTAFLQDGCRPCVEVTAAARDAGIAEKTLVRAKKLVRVQSVKLAGDHGVWVWCLHHHTASERRARYQP